MNLIYIFCSTVTLFILLKLWNKLTTGRCKSTSKMNGKTIVITGANAGIGRATALDLARRGARVILACRNKQLGEQAIEDIRKLTSNGELVIKHLDLSKQCSIRQFAEEINREESRLDVLINNAGVGGGIYPRKLTEDCIEITFAVNYFGPFLLTNLLLDKLKATAPSRIINVSSALHWYGTILLEDINGDHYYNPVTVYSNTKLALNVFTHHLAGMLNCTEVTVNSLHPGAVNTDIFRSMPAPLMMITKAFMYLFYKNPEEGAETTIHLTVSDEVAKVTGKYFSDCQVAKESPQVLHKQTAIHLWALSKKLTKLNIE